jgi:hypothetical protein
VKNILDHGGKVLLGLVWTELCLGGGGRFTSWGPLSLRMIFFALALVFVVVSVIFERKSIPAFYGRLLILFFVVLVIGLAIGLLHHADRALWWEDIKPLLYFFILPFFVLVIRTERDVAWVARILKVSACVMATIFIGLVLLIHFRLLDFLFFYRLTSPSEEIFYRGEVTFFYKGFIFLGIGTVFFYFTETPRTAVKVIPVLVMGLFLSLTRGLWLALMLTSFAHFVVKRSILKAAWMLAAAGLVLFLGQMAVGELSYRLAKDYVPADVISREGAYNLLGDREFSDGERVRQIRQVTSSTSSSSLLIGHGFGIGVPVRPVHMEISYLEIFHKQGIIGLAFWAVLLFALWQKFREAKSSGLANAFFLGSLFVFLQSFTNQYMNNPIGLSMILISIVCLDRLKTPND